MTDIKINCTEVFALEYLVSMYQDQCRKIMFGPMWDVPSDTYPHWTEQTFGDAANHCISKMDDTKAAATLCAMAAEILAAETSHLSNEEMELRKEWLKIIAACFC